MIVRTVTDVLPEFPNSEVTFYRRGGTFTLDEAYPARQQSVTTDSNGVYSIDLWPNTEGLSETSYLAVYPGKDTFEFVLEPSDVPITASELRAQAAWDWHTSIPPTNLDLERARYANKVSQILGDFLIGYQSHASGSVGRTVDDKLEEAQSAWDFIPESERAAIIDRSTTYDAGPALTALFATPGRKYLAAGTYAIYTSVEMTDDLEIMAERGVIFEMRDGSESAGFFADRKTNITIDGIEIIDAKTIKRGTALSLYNCSQVTLRRLTPRLFMLYGIGIHDNPNGHSVTASTISYSGNTISDSANGLGDFVPGQVGISGSLFNNQIVNVTAVTPGALTVAETLVTEAAGASRAYASSNTISFDATTHIISATEPMFKAFLEDERGVVSGASQAANNQTINIIDVDIDGFTMTVAEDLVTEGAGATITITKIGRSMLLQMDIGACDDILVEYCYFDQIGRIGLEIFPKAESRNVIARHCFFNECGRAISGGTAIKVGQATSTAQVYGHIIQRSQIGAIITMWNSANYHDMLFIDCYKHGIAIGFGDHIRYTAAPFHSLKVHNMLFLQTPDFEPAGPYPVIGFTGTKLTDGQVDVYDISGAGWSAGLYCKYILAPHSNIRLRDIALVDCGSSLFVPVLSLADLTSGSSVLANIRNREGTPTLGGWAIGAHVNGTGIPTDARIIDYNPVAKTLTIGDADGNPVTATATATNVQIYSAYLDQPRISRVEWENTDATVNLTAQMYADDAVLQDLYFKGMGAYGLQLTGGATLMGGRWFDPNPLGTADRGVILLGAGDFTLHDNLAFADATQIAYMVNNDDATTVRIDGTYSPIDDTVRPLRSTSPVTASGIWSQYGSTRQTYGTSAPSDTSIVRVAGDFQNNTAPTPTLAIRGWHNLVTGSTGQVWRAMGRGRGTTAQRPTPALLDVDYEFWDTSKRKNYLWSGTAWDTMTGIKTLFQANAATTIANTTTETSMIPSGVGSVSLSSVFFAAASGVRLRLEGTFADTGTPTLRIRAKLGSTVIVDTTALALPALGGTRMWTLDCQLVCRTAGASGTIEGSLVFRFATADVGTEYVFNVPQAATTFNTTVATTIALTAQWGTADPANTLTTNLCRIEDIT